ncbi:hypothetical protein BDV96DRAFT_665136 [Lophiotrema nucula]|uniref:Uncharacterized protein n=1 Tax=Lophiotrema nucula TaxID=690887 RepID=A0A6A5YYC8_9PLEO|nr:hypothetical protein BDV96DRAFT_665136 [Lophiotrema nucula]
MRRLQEAGLRAQRLKDTRLGRCGSATTSYHMRAALAISIVGKLSGEVTLGPDQSAVQYMPKVCTLACGARRSADDCQTAASPKRKSAPDHEGGTAGTCTRPRRTCGPVGCSMATAPGSRRRPLRSKRCADDWRQVLADVALPCCARAGFAARTPPAEPAEPAEWPARTLIPDSQGSQFAMDRPQMNSGRVMREPAGNKWSSQPSRTPGAAAAVLSWTRHAGMRCCPRASATSSPTAKQSRPGSQDGGFSVRELLVVPSQELVPSNKYARCPSRPQASLQHTLPHVVHALTRPLASSLGASQHSTSAGPRLALLQPPVPSKRALADAAP